MSSKRLLLTLFGSKGCGLCHEAKESILNVRRAIPFEFQEVDIHQPEHKKRWEKYTFDIPVVHLNGEEILMHAVDETKLAEQLKKRMNE
ncbi:glutaredoxin 2 [Basidiobolus meristosporus CBS 931.73]|uniref:Glutaredoxin-like protein n=1 Tax=Basidiobolus meristosporus CBS 931.73 TaxID=1314790 RepID=A0A1Y1Y335_9FUNG|nr:glutaredoxin 2 [Basidiobolus meristosporus CBS 931.73]|eukprot:ORX92432.1 glutaredoxin 2 [Basidiobolus meristosporus CBS 931.73]